MCAEARVKHWENDNPDIRRDVENPTCPLRLAVELLQQHCHPVICPHRASESSSSKQQRGPLLAEQQLEYSIMSSSSQDDFEDGSRSSSSASSSASCDSGAALLAPSSFPNQGSEGKAEEEPEQRGRVVLANDKAAPGDHDSHGGAGYTSSSGEQRRWPSFARGVEERRKQLVLAPQQFSTPRRSERRRRSAWNRQSRRPA